MVYTPPMTIKTEPVVKTLELGYFEKVHEEPNTELPTSKPTSPQYSITVSVNDIPKSGDSPYRMRVGVYVLVSVYNNSSTNMYAHAEVYRNGSLAYGRDIWIVNKEGATGMFLIRAEDGDTFDVYIWADGASMILKNVIIVEVGTPYLTRRWSEALTLAVKTKTYNLYGEPKTIGSFGLCHNDAPETSISSGSAKIAPVLAPSIIANETVTQSTTEPSTNSHTIVYPWKIAWTEGYQ